MQVIEEDSKTHSTEKIPLPFGEIEFEYRTLFKYPMSKQI